MKREKEANQEQSTNHDTTFDLFDEFTLRPDTTRIKEEQLVTTPEATQLAEDTEPTYANSNVPLIRRPIDLEDLITYMSRRNRDSNPFEEEFKVRGIFGIY